MLSTTLRRLLTMAAVAALGWASWAAPAHAAPRLPVGRWPVAGTPQVVRPFDPPATPWGSGHRGVDLAARAGDQVLAAADGTVTFAGTVAGRGVVSVTHGEVLTTYEPVRVVVRAGDRVRAGQRLGTVTTGSHCPTGCLHWGLRHGHQYLDPLVLVGTGGDDGDGVRLVAASRRAVVEREARARATAAALAATATATRQAAAWTAGPPGSHGFLHPVPGAITSPYGMRFHPVLHRWKLHDGTDFGAGCGTAMRAPYAGRVTQAYFNQGYGNRLIISHGRVDGHGVETAYNHAQRYVVAPGQSVRRGQVIGYVGTTGFSTGCHLHLMVWLDGRLVNPMSWFS